LWREKAELRAGKWEIVCLDEDPVLIGINTRLGEAVKTAEKVWACEIQIIRTWAWQYCEMKSNENQLAGHSVSHARPGLMSSWLGCNDDGVARMRPGIPVSETPRRMKDFSMRYQTFEIDGSTANHQNIHFHAFLEDPS
jgi:hypothetical protein